jgi:hypothetical protein
VSGLSGGGGGGEKEFFPSWAVENSSSGLITAVTLGTFVMSGLPFSKLSIYAPLSLL